AKETSRSTSRWPASVSKLTERLSTERSGPPSMSAPLQPRVECITQAVSEQVESDHRDAERDAAEQREIGVALQRRQAVPDHAAPARLRFLNAEPDEAERRLRHDDEADADGGAHQEGRGDVGQEVNPEDPSGRRAGHDRSVDEEFL